MLQQELERTRARLEEADAALLSLRAALEASHAEVRTLYASLSWRITRPLRAMWDFLAGLPPFLRELRDFPRRARYTLAQRGAAALASDITGELSRRIRQGSLGPPSGSARRGRDLASMVARLKRGERPALRLPPVDRPRASIVIPAYGEFDHTHACVASILEATDGVSYEVIVADDGSRDETRNVERIIPGVRAVRSDENLGFIDACNRGAAAARGEVIVFLNNDCLVTPGWLDHLLLPFADPEVGLVGAKLVYPDGRLQEAGGIIFSDASGWNYGRSDDAEDPRYAFRRDVDYCSGACIAIPRNAFEELGGFDVGFAPMYYEDVDLAFALRAAGRRVVYQPAAVVVHMEGGTAGTDTGSGAKRYQPINQRRLIEKWGPQLAAHPPPASGPDGAHWRDGGPHVLVIDSYTPRPDWDAGSLRMVNVMRILRGLGCRVSFLPENRAHDGDYTRGLQALGVEAFYHPYLPSLKDHLSELGSRYDAVVLCRVEVAEQVLGAVAEYCPRARRIFDTVDLHFLRESRREQLGPSSGKGRAEQLRQQELAVARACDVTFVVSEAERELLAREAPDVRVEVVSLLHEVAPTGTPFEERSGILFIGNFQHPPNIDAMEYYLGEIHPRVSEQLPEAEVTVIGDNVPASLQRLAGDGVRFTGHVPDIAPLFSATRLSMAPLRYGAGVKGKITSSLAFGVPIVTTTIGVEGTGLEDGEHVLVADDAEAFADAIVTLYRDAALWERLVRNGGQSVKDRFSFARAEGALARVLGLETDTAPGS